MSRGGVKCGASHGGRSFARRLSGVVGAGCVGTVAARKTPPGRRAAEQRHQHGTNWSTGTVPTELPLSISRAVPR